VSHETGNIAGGDHGGDTPEERTIFFLAKGCRRQGPATYR
jgi:hypothetical protein